MKAFAYVEENLNAKWEKHAKKGKEGRVKNEVHKRCVGTPFVVEEIEGEILELTRQVEELQGSLKHLRGLAKREVIIRFLLAMPTVQTGQMRPRLLKHLALWRGRDASPVDCNHRRREGLNC